MKKQSLYECILDAMEKFGMIDDQFFARFLAGWIRQAIKNNTVEIEKEELKK